MTNRLITVLFLKFPAVIISILVLSGKDIEIFDDRLE